MAHPDGDQLKPSAVLTIPFCGQRSGCDQLTWSQRGMWRLGKRLGSRQSFLNMRELLRLPDGMTLTDVTRTLRLVVEQHEALRTTVCSGDDGEPQQHVADRGEFTLRVYEADDASDSDLAERLSLEYLGRPFRDDEWPLQVAAVNEGGVPRFLVLVVSHLAVDWWGLRILSAELSRLLSDTEPTLTSRYQPLDHVASEESEKSKRGIHRTADYWRRTLMTAPQTMFAVQPSLKPVRWCPRAVLASRALPMAAAVLARRYKVPAPVVVLAAAATLLGIRTGNERVMLLLLAPNRYGAQTREMVGTLFQPALFTVDIDGQSFGDVVVRSGASAMAAYRYSRYPPEEIDRVIAEVQAARGINLELECYARTVWEDAPDLTAAGDASAKEIAEARSSSQLDITVSWGRRFDFQLDVDQDEDGRVYLVVTADPRFLSRDDLAGLLRGIETLVVRSVTADAQLSDIGELTGTVPWSRSADARLVDHCWVEPAAIADLLCSVPGVAAAQVSVGEDADGRAEIVGHVSTDQEELTEQALHRACLARLPGTRTVVAPQRYVVHRESGSFDALHDARSVAE